MAENQVPFLFNVTQHGLDILGKARTEIQSLMGVLRGAAATPTVIETDVILNDAGVVQGIRRIGKAIDDENQKVAKSIAVVHTKTLRASMRQALALRDSRETLNRTIKTLYGETDKEVIDAALNAAGVTTPNLVAETRLLMDMRNRVNALQNIHSSIERQLAIESGATQTPRKALGAGVKRSYSFSTGGKTVEEQTARYNRLVGPAQQIVRLPGMTLDEFDDIVLAKWLELMQPTILRQDAISARAALQLGHIRGPKGLITDDKLQKFIRSLRPRLLEEQPELVVAAGLQDIFGGDVSKESLKLFRKKLLQQAITGEISGQELLQALTSSAGLPSESLLSIYRNIQTQEPKSLLRDIDRGVAPVPLLPLPSKVPELAPERRIKPPRGGTGPRLVIDPADPYNPLGLSQFQLAAQERYAVMQAMAALQAASRSTALVKYFPPGAAAARMGVPGATLRGGAFDLIGPGGVAAGGPGWVYGQPTSTALTRPTGTAMVTSVPPGMALVPTTGMALVPLPGRARGGGGPSAEPIETDWMPIRGRTGTGLGPPAFVAWSGGPGGGGPGGGGWTGGPFYRGQFPGPGYANLGTAIPPGGWMGGGGAPPVSMFGGTPAPGFGPPPGGGGGGQTVFSKFMGRFSSLAYYLGAGAILYPIVGAIYETIRRARELEVIVTRIKAIYGSNTLSDQLDIKQSIVQTAGKLSTDVLETARAAQLLAQEGLSQKEFLPNLKAISQGAIGLGIPQEGLANFIIAVRNATLNPRTGARTEGQEMVNLLAAFFKRGAVSPQNLMTSIQQVLPSLEAFTPSDSGISDPAIVGAITSLVARRTSFTGSQVSNAVRYFIARFGSPQTAEEIERIAGIYLGTKESGGEELRPFQDILQDLSKKYRQFIDEGQASRAQALLKNLFGLRQVGVGGNILQSWELIMKEATEVMNDQASAADLAAKSQATLNAALERLSTAFTNLGGVVVDALKVLAVGLGYLVAPNTTTGRTNIDFTEWLTTILGAGFGQFYGNPAIPFGVAEWNYQRRAGVGGTLDPTNIGLVPEPLANFANPPTPMLGPFGRPLSRRSIMFDTKLPQNPRELWQAISSNYGVIGGTLPPPPPPGTYKGSMSEETAPLFNPTNWTAFYRRWQSIDRRITGQDYVADILKMSKQDPVREYNQLISLFEGFYSAIGAENRGNISIDEWIRMQNRKLYDEPLMVKGRLEARLPEVMQNYINYLQEQFDYAEGKRRSDDRLQAGLAQSRLAVKTRRAFGRKGLDANIGELLQDSLEDIFAERAKEMGIQDRAYEQNLRDLADKYAQGGVPERVYEEQQRQAKEADTTKRLELQDKYNLLQMEAEITAQYQTRLNIIKQIEALSNEINKGIQGALYNLPALANAPGGIAKFFGQILSQTSGTLYGNVLSSVNLFGREGLFPGVGKKLDELTGPPPDLTGLLVPFITPGGEVTNVPVQSQAEYKKAQRDAQIRAFEIAVAAMIGSYAGKGGPGAQTGSQLGAIGGMALLGGKLGAFGGPIGAIAGGIIGGLFGGIFDKKDKKPPELVALEKIAANTGEQTTLLQNTNRLLELQNIAFNVPTGFTLPRYGPMNAMGGGGNSINVEVNIGSTSSSPQQIGAVVAQAISERLSNEYTSGGRYVARNGY
jgi:TP901 family phage tail tape measure protein